MVVVVDAGRWTFCAQPPSVHHPVYYDVMRPRAGPRRCVLPECLRTARVLVTSSCSTLAHALRLRRTPSAVYLRALVMDGVPVCQRA